MEPRPGPGPARPRAQLDPSPFYLARTGFNAPVWRHALFQHWFGVGPRPRADPVPVWTTLGALMDDLLSEHRAWISDLVGGVGEMRLRSISDLCWSVSGLHHKLSSVAGGGPVTLLAQLEDVRDRITGLVIDDILIMPCGWGLYPHLHLIIIKDPTPDLFTVAVANCEESDGVADYHPGRAGPSGVPEYLLVFELCGIDRYRLESDVFWFLILDMIRDTTNSALYTARTFYEVVLGQLTGPTPLLQALNVQSPYTEWISPDLDQDPRLAGPVRVVQYLLLRKGFNPHQADRIMFTMRRQMFYGCSADLNREIADTDTLRPCGQRMARYTADAIDHGLVKGDQLPQLKVRVTSSET